MKKLGVLIAVLFLGASSAWGFGGGKGGMQGGQGYGMNCNFASNVSLTDAQRAELQSQA